VGGWRASGAAEARGKGGGRAAINPPAALRPTSGPGAASCCFFFFLTIAARQSGRPRARSGGRHCRAPLSCPVLRLGGRLPPSDGSAWCRPTGRGRPGIESPRRARNTMLSPSSLADAVLACPADPLATLLPGRPRTSAGADPRALRTAFRRAARQLHPDKNPCPRAGAAFAALSAAMEAGESVSGGTRWSDFPEGGATARAAEPPPAPPAPPADPAVGAARAAWASRRGGGGPASLRAQAAVGARAQAPPAPSRAAAPPPPPAGRLSTTSAPNPADAKARWAAPAVARPPPRKRPAPVKRRRPAPAAASSLGGHPAPGSPPVHADSDGWATASPSSGMVTLDEGSDSPSSSDASWAPRGAGGPETRTRPTPVDRRPASQSASESESRLPPRRPARRALASSESSDGSDAIHDASTTPSDG